MIRRERGFSLPELLMVIAIIAILAAIAIPNLLTALNKARQKRTMADMRTVAAAWEARATDFGKYNAAAGYFGVSEPVTMDDLSDQLMPTYIKVLPQRDGWGRSFTAFVDQPWADANLTGQRYVVASGGRDGVIDPSQVLGPFTNFDCDIIYTNGTFVAYPQGMQQGN